MRKHINKMQLYALFRNVFCFFVANLLIACGFVKKVKRNAFFGKYILSIYFHAPDKKFFESCVRWLLKNGFSVISIQDLEAISRLEIPFPKGAVTITVDDGWACNRNNIVSIADKYNIPVTIFVSTEPVVNGIFWWSYIKNANLMGILNQSIESLKKIPDKERIRIVNQVKPSLSLTREAMTIKEVQEVSQTQFVSIGSHTVTHPVLPTCCRESACFEITESKKILENWINKEISEFAYPNGDFSSREIEILKASGYKMAFTTESKYLTKVNIADLYTLPRFAVFEEASFAENICRMTGVWFTILPSALQKLNVLSETIENTCKLIIRKKRLRNANS